MTSFPTQKQFDWVCASVDLLIEATDQFFDASWVHWLLWLRGERPSERAPGCGPVWLFPAPPRQTFTTVWGSSRWDKKTWKEVLQSCTGLFGSVGLVISDQTPECLKNYLSQQEQRGRQILRIEMPFLNARRPSCES